MADPALIAFGTAAIAINAYGAYQYYKSKRALSQAAAQSAGARLSGLKAQFESEEKASIPASPAPHVELIAAIDSTIALAAEKPKAKTPFPENPPQLFPSLEEFEEAQAKPVQEESGAAQFEEAFKIAHKWNQQKQGLQGDFAQPEEAAEEGGEESLEGELDVESEIESLKKKDEELHGKIAGLESLVEKMRKKQKAQSKK